MQVIQQHCVCASRSRIAFPFANWIAPFAHINVSPVWNSNETKRKLCWWASRSVHRHRHLVSIFHIASIGYLNDNVAQQHPAWQHTHNYTMFCRYTHTRTSYTTAIGNAKYFVLFSHCYLTTAQQRQQQHEICSRSAGYRSGTTMVNIEIQLNWNISMFCNATHIHYTQTHVDRFFFLVKLSVACSVSQLQCYPAFDLHYTDIHWILYW